MKRVTVHREASSDPESIRQVVCAAFSTSDEADLVESLRENGNLIVSLIAKDSAGIVGHIGFSPVSIVDGSPLSKKVVGAGLAPISVLPSHQKLGIGSQLVRAGLDACRDSKIDYVVVLGEPGYYKRFGFEKASELGLKNEYGADSEFRVIQLSERCLTNVTGIVQFASEFRTFS